MPEANAVPEPRGTVRAVGPPPLPLLYWLFPAASFALGAVLGAPSAIYSPDASSYRLLALGQNAAVPMPFAVRVLGPMTAGWLGRVTGLGADTGFLLLGIVCMAALLIFIARLLWVSHLLGSQRPPAALFAAIFLMPFWVYLFHDYYLPDLLHAALLAALLWCLVSGRTMLAMLLLFPAYVARESTELIALCLIFAAWRRISIRPAIAGILATAGGVLVSRHYGKLGAPNLHGMGGGTYIVGKLVWGFFRNMLGFSLWTNTLPACPPIWKSGLPYGHHLGGIAVIGLCSFSLWGPARVLLAWFGMFGIAPAVALCLRGKLLSPRTLTGAGWLSSFSLQRSSGGVDTRPEKSGFSPNGALVAFRFSVFYGLIMLLVAPALGASTDRLVGYAWPIFFVALPWVLVASPELLCRKNAWLLPLHLITCWAAWFEFGGQGVAGFFYGGLAAFGLNIVAYAALKRSMKSRSRAGSQIQATATGI